MEQCEGGVSYGGRSSHIFGKHPVKVTCPRCKRSVMTYVEENISKMAYMWCLVLCIAGAHLCSISPFFLDNFTKYNHYCSNCNGFLGAYEV